MKTTLLAALAGMATTLPQDAGDPRPARYVRVELPGDGRVLSLAEVWVVADGENVAPGGLAKQSSVGSGGGPGRANDGSTNGKYQDGSVSHTASGADPWWELDLGAERVVDQVSVFNRTDCCGDRLEGFRLVLLDEERELVWAREGIPAPAPRADFSLWGAPVVTPRLSYQAKRALQEGIDAAIDGGVEYLLRTQLRDGSWGQHQGTHRSGQTALSLYTLVKAGVPKDHPAVRHAVAFLRANGAASTYSAGCLLMALEALDDPGHRDWIEEVAYQLVEWQGGRDGVGSHPGIWAYPVRPNTTVDLSNTQYALLGLRAAMQAGVDVPSRVFHRVLDDLPDYRGRVERIKGLGRDSRGMEVGGFMYRAAGGHGGTSGSMTTAGLACIHICEEALGGRLPGRYRDEIEDVRAGAFEWLHRNVAIPHNPGRGGSWHYYYLYGLERVGALYDMEEIGGLDWYWEGAQYLVPRQGDDGAWKNQTDTCFAVLFLRRATASSTGPREAALDDLYVAEGATTEVRWRGTGDDEVTFWITGFDDEMLAMFAPTESPSPGLRVLRVEYLVDGEVVETIPGDPTRPWRGERFATRQRFDEPGRYVVELRVVVVDPEARVAGEGEAELHGAPLEVVVETAAREAAFEYARQGRDNRIRAYGVERVHASSERNGGNAAGKAVDGLQSTAWIAKPGDAQPSIEIELARPVRASRILLSSANLNATHANGHDKATKVAVWLNRDDEPLVFDVEPDDLEKAELPLETRRPIRRLSIQILEREKGERWPGHVGFAEIELLDRERRR